MRPNTSTQLQIQKPTFDMWIGYSQGKNQVLEAVSIARYLWKWDMLRISFDVLHFGLSKEEATVQTNAVSKKKKTKGISF